MEDNALTRTDMAAQASKLQTVYRDLQTANLTVGYLEATLKNFQEQCDAMALAKSQAERLAEYEQENQQMLEIYEQAKTAEDLAYQNEALREQLRSISPKPARQKAYTMQDYYSMIQRHLER
jgi:cell shape-determining protein MreC